MKNTIAALLLIISAHFAIAQNNEKETLKKTEDLAAKPASDKPNGWVKKGTFTFLANQATFNNWLAGGQSNVSGNVNLNYDFNYKYNNYSWDNKVIAAYGLTKIKNQQLQKTDDRFEFNSLAGLKAFGSWYYSAFLNLKTQFDSGFDLATNTKTTHFLSPAFAQFGPGLMYKKSDNLKFNIAPATSKLIYVDKQFTQLAPSFGVKQGQTTRFEFGAAASAYYKFNIMQNVSFENILALYTNYLDQPQNVDLDYQANIVMKVNTFLSANIAYQTIYDDNAYSGFQTRQVIGIGVNYSF